MFVDLMAVNVILQKSNSAVRRAPASRRGPLLDCRRLACENRGRLCRGA